MIIDTHVHIGEMLGFSLTEEMVLESMKKYHINYSLISNLESAEYDHDLNPIKKELQFSQIESLNRCLSFAKKHKDQIGVCVWIKPATEQADEQLIHSIEENRDMIYGMKVHPFHSKTAFDHEKMKPFLEIARRFHLPIVTHTGGCEEADPIHVYNMAKAYPDLTFVMVHLDLGTDNQKAIQLLGELPNLYGDTTWVPMEHTISVVEQYGSEKILFGSDSPIDGVDTYHHNPKGDLSLYQPYFHELERRIGSKHYENIMYRNAIRLFHLPIKE